LQQSEPGLPVQSVVLSDYIVEEMSDGSKTVKVTYHDDDDGSVKRDVEETPKVTGVPAIFYTSSRHLWLFAPDSAP